ncbi:MAG: CHAD domain-containing protein [Alphaproteobacteria bacterium]|nr:MAG: CHAD domain-containing protein [Alphaproteobacteria bacterium]
MAHSLVKIRPDVSAAEMASLQTGRWLKDVLFYLPKAAGKKEGKARYVHQLRVAARRAAAALDLYAGFMPQKQKVKLEKELKEIRRAAGKARDLDMLIALLEKERTGQGAAQILKLARRSRDKAQKELVRIRRRADEHDVAGLAGKLVKGIGTADGKDARFGPWSRAQLRPSVRAFFDAVPAAGAGLEELHAFRIRSKQLRYKMEMVQRAFPSAFKKDVLPRIESLQQRLGDINDIASRQRRMRKWISRGAGKRLSVHLRERIALDDTRLAAARADFAAYCTANFLQQLHEKLDGMLAGLIVVSSSPRLAVRG